MPPTAVKQQPFTFIVSSLYVEYMHDYCSGYISLATLTTDGAWRSPPPRLQRERSLATRQNTRSISTITTCSRRFFCGFPSSLLVELRAVIKDAFCIQCTTTTGLLLHCQMQLCVIVYLTTLRSLQPIT